MASTYVYGNALAKALLQEMDFDSGATKLCLLTNSYSPAQDTHDYYNDVSGVEVAAGGGYSTGGSALGTPAVSYLTATTATAWAATTAYQLGDIVRPVTPNAHVYICIAAGTSGGSEPSWSTTTGANVSDSTVTWLEIGRGYVKVDGDDVTWSSSTITAAYAALYWDSGTPATSPLIAYVDFGGDQSSSNGNFTVAWDSTGILVIPVR